MTGVLPDDKHAAGREQAAGRPVGKPVWRGRPDIHKLSARLEMYRGIREPPVLEPLPATHPVR